jgi:hypothetical protein
MTHVIVMQEAVVECTSGSLVSLHKVVPDAGR